MQSKYEKMTKYTLAVNEIKELQDYKMTTISGRMIGIWRYKFKIRIKIILRNREEEKR